MVMHSVADERKITNNKTVNKSFHLINVTVQSVCMRVSVCLIKTHLWLIQVVK